MREGKKLVVDRKGEELILDSSNKVIFKESNKFQVDADKFYDFRETFINVNTDASLESEKEKNNISLLSLLKKRLKEKSYSRFLITFRTNSIEKQKNINDSLSTLLKENFEEIKGICLFINIYSVMLLETEHSYTIFNFLKDLKLVPCVTDVQILYFSELNKPGINEAIYFYNYTCEELKKGISHDPCYVDKV